MTVVKIISVTVIFSVLKLISGAHVQRDDVVSNIKISETAID